nr:ATP-binding cassette domain-containing protein [Tatumella citrea]
MNNQQTAAAAATFSLTQAQVSIDNRQLLKPLSLEFTPHRVTGLIGHNGSGKSTLIKLLSRQNPGFSGTVQWNGKPLSEWGAREFARQVAYLPQSLPAAEGMTVAELVALGRYAWHGALGKMSEHDRQSIDQAIASVDLSWATDHLVENLSGGERQRAWIAMCVVQGSHCLLLDEPTSALDIAHQKEVLSVIQQLCRQRQLTVIMVLHDINMAARFCDEFVALKQGEQIFHGSVADLMTEQRLEQIYSVPMGVIHHPDSGDLISYVR